jgi:transcription initiation factor IIE alpha subunit
MAKALADEKVKKDKPKRRKKMAKKVKLKELAERSKKKAKFETEEVKAPEKKAKPNGDGKLIPLKKICEELDIDPKATRVKLRRLIAKGTIDFHDASQRWEFTAAQAKEIRSHLS